ncbi:class I SAM-dependent methyltransferase [soil metagenome]
MRTSLLALAVLATACATSPTGTTKTPSASGLTVSPEIAAAVDAADRDQGDRDIDAGRDPKDTLAFFGVAPGMKVGDVGAGLGYTSELLARVVGPQGQVFAENPEKLRGFVGADWNVRLGKPIMKNVVRVDRELDDPFPAEAKDLDLVTMILIYHDAVWMGVDRDKLNRAVFAALKSGGIFGIIDHSAKPGDGTNVVQTFHRIEESVVIDEVKRAGFVLDGQGTFLKNASDTRDWNDSPSSAGNKRGTSDRFVLRFKKP